MERDNEGSDRAFTHPIVFVSKRSTTSYDAIYLELTMRRSLPLATLDDDSRPFRIWP